MKIKLSAGLLFLPIILLLSSCASEENPFSETYFLSQYEGSFTKKGEATLPERWSQSYLRHFKITSWYSSALEKEILVTNLSDNAFVPEYQSNFLYLKYEDKISEQIETFAKKDFSDVRAAYDLDWEFCSSQDSEESLKRILFDMKWGDVFLLIRPNEEELADFSTRLDSLCYRLYTENFRGDIYIFFTQKSESELDFSSLTFDSLYTDSDTKNKFYKRYLLDTYRQKREEL